MGCWPPFLANGIRVRRIADDWRSIDVTLAKSPLTSNYFGTQFGGSMFAMTDPFFAIMLVRLLGPAYTVWDKSAEIEFVKPRRTRLEARLKIADDQVEEIRTAAAAGEKVLRWFAVDISDSDGDLVAVVRKQLYVRLKPRDRS